MNLSKMKIIIAGRLQKHGSEYTINGVTVNALILKTQNRPLFEYTLLAGHNATIAGGYIVSGNGQYYVPTKYSKPNVEGGNEQYIRGYLLQSNASIDISSYVDPANASKDKWDQPSGTEGTDWGWVIKKTGVYGNFERMEMRPDQERVGQVENAEYLVALPWSVNASFTPVAESRLTDRNSKNWKVLDVDDKSYINQAYILRVSTDDR